MYDKTVTIFNKCENEDEEICWYPHVVTKCDLIINKTANIVKTGLDSADTANLHIKYTTNSDKKIVCGKEYYNPKEWSKQEEDRLTETITFAEGDFFIDTEYEETVIKDKDYTNRVNGGFYDYMNKKYDHVYKITNIGGPYTLIKHFEIGGK